MRALLVLFMVDSVQNGGLGLTDKNATAIYGIYTAAVYLLALPGGWVADRLIGAQKSVFWGGCVIALGHFSLAVPSQLFFFLGLFLVAIGSGLLKPSMSTIVGALYSPDDRRRDAGFTVFYMGINIGAMLGPLICGGLGQSDTFGWHWGFAAAGVGMTVGLVQYRLSQHKLGSAGATPHSTTKKPKQAWVIIGLIIAVPLAFTLLGAMGLIAISPLMFAKRTAQIVSVVFVLYFVYIWIAGGLNQSEFRRSIVIFVLCLAAAVFWSGFEQAGSSLNLFADRYTDNTIDALNLTIPSSWYQSLNALFIIMLAPLFSLMWVALAKRMLEPSSPIKFGLGLVLLGLGFAVMIGAANIVTKGGQAAPYWLVLTYLLHTLGELCLSPVGLSTISRLAPRAYASQMMGLWFCAAALGNILAGLLAGRFDTRAVEDFPAIYIQIVIICGVAGLLLLILGKYLHQFGQLKNTEQEKIDI